MYSEGAVCFKKLLTLSLLLTLSPSLSLSLSPSLYFSFSYDFRLNRVLADVTNGFANCNL